MQRSLMRVAKSLACAAVLALPLRSASADIVTMAFPLSCAGNNVTLIPGTYAEAGFTLVASAQMAFWCTGSPNFAGSGVFVNAFGGTGTVTRDGGGAFGATSIDLASVFAGSNPGGPLTFVGHLIGGGTVQQTFQLGASQGTPAFTTFSFNQGFANLASLDLAVSGNIQGGPPPLYQFTNIRMNTLTTVTPEPSSILLMATGLLVLVAFQRARRRSKS